MKDEDANQKIKKEFHVNSKQEKHLPHEAWQVIQQKQGRVPANLETKDETKSKDNLGE